jgi:beta-lactamase class A
LLDKFVSKMVTDILIRQVVDNRFPVLLPADTKLIHKTGNLDFVVHDVGVIYGLNGPMILIAMAQAPSNEDRATQVEQRLALIAYGDYNVPPVKVTLLATPVMTDGTSVEGATSTPEA